MTRAEKDELMKTWKAEREANQTTTTPSPVKTAQPVKTFEVDGEQIPYEEPRGAGYGKDKNISNNWLAIAKAGRDND